MTRQTRLLNTASYSLERRGEGVGMPEARWRHMRRELDGFVMRCYYEMVSTCSIMLFCRLSRYLALYSRLIDAEIGQNATRHLSVTPPRDIFFFAPGSIAAMTEAKEKTCKVRTVVSLSSSRARVRKREKERERRESRSRMDCQMSWTQMAVPIGTFPMPALRDIFTSKFCPLIHPDQGIDGRRRGSRNEIEYES